MSQISFFYITMPDAQKAEEIAEKLVQEKLIACANIFPQMKSVYLWREQIQKESEAVMIVKTNRSFAQIQARIKTLHPYQAPCIAEITLDSINSEYKQWLLSALS